MGSMIKTPMTRDEALKILNIEDEEQEEPEHEAKQIMERFETIFEKNLPEKGGSFYIQSKVYFAKEFLMQDYPLELNKSQYNPGAEAEEKNEEAAAEGEKKEETKEDKSGESKEAPKSEDKKQWALIIV